MENDFRSSQSTAVSPLCFGTALWGATINGPALDALYDQFRAAGGNFFDSAHCYAFWIKGSLGASERALGDLVHRRGDRGDVVIATKGGHPAAGPDYPRPDRFLSPEAIESDVNDSLERLRMDRIDLYYLHRDDPRVPVGEIIDALAEQVARGRVTSIGASNWTTSRIADANAYAAKAGKPGFVANQPLYALAERASALDATARNFDREDYGWHERTRMPVCAYSPTANGYFATDGTSGPWATPASRAKLDVARRLGAELGATPTQVALAYLLHHPFPVIPILGTTNDAHLAEALGATDVRLTPQQFGELQNAPAF